MGNQDTCVPSSDLCYNSASLLRFDNCRTGSRTHGGCCVNENIIAWNVTNWVTVILMAAIGFFLLGIAQKWMQQQRQKNAIVPTTSNNMQPSFAR